MNNISTVEFDSSSTNGLYAGTWPFSSDGLFPLEIFSSEHLYDVIFTLWPKYFNCPVVTVRQAVKAHLKRYAPLSLKSVNRGQVERDRAMVEAFAFTPTSRIKAKEISFHREDNVNRFGKSRKKNSVLEPDSSFGQLVAISYQSDPELKPVFDWFLECAQPKTIHERERYLTGPLLEDGLKKKLCPVEVSSVEFARMVLLYASLSKSLDEKILLVETAESLGCTQLGILRKFNAAESNSSSYDDVLPNVEFPKLFGSAAKNILDWEVEAESLRVVEEFDSCISEFSRSSEQIAEFEFESLTDLIELSEERWKSLLLAIQEARELSRSTLRYRSEIQELEAQRWASLFKRLNIDAIWYKHSPGTDEKLVSGFLSVCRANNSIADLNPSFNQVEVWRSSFNGTPGLAEIEKLIELASAEVGNRSARAVYREECYDFIKKMAPQDVGRYMSGLSGAELGALINISDGSCWLVESAVLLRAALDRENIIPSSVIDVVLTAETVEKRRALLNFVDPNSAIVNDSIAFRRVIAVERFRDIFLFEPVAQILDPSSGLSDIELVGRNVIDIAELISINSSLLLTGTDVSRLLRQGPSDERASASLVEFANTPVTMRGNFRRLKEKARDKLIKFTFKNDEPVPKLVLVLLEDIENGVFSDSLFFELQEERADDKLEQRHREQLTRYVAHMERLLKDFISEVQHQPDTRLKSVSAKLKRLVRQLRCSDEVGSLEWLEGQFLEIISNTVIGNNVPTLRGKGDAIVDSLWTSENTAWATDFIELPEFYFESSISVWDVGVSSLYWHGSCGEPSGLQIASRLLESLEFQGAIKFAIELGDDGVRSFVLSAVTPKVDAMNERISALKKECDENILENIEEYKLFCSSLEVFDLGSAAEHLELLELLATELSKESSLGSKGGLERRGNLLKFFGMVGITFDEPLPGNLQLEKLWLNVLAAHVSERMHLTVVEKAFDTIDNASEGLSKVISAFVEGNCDPERWLSADTAADFSDFVREPSSALASWAKSAPMYILAEQQASYVMCEWFLDFVVERSRSIRQLEDADSLSSAMDRVFEVSAIIVNSARPALCLAQLVESGELAGELASFVSDNRLTAIDGSSRSFSARHSPIEIASYSSDIVMEVTASIRNELWEAASKLCEKINGNEGGESAHLYGMSEVFIALADSSEMPSTLIVDKLPLAANWLSTLNEYTSVLPESKRVDLAYRVLTGAIAADSGEQMARSPTANGGWTDILGRLSPFRKMLVGGVSYRVEKVLEALLTGCLSVQVAERLWDAATKINDPHLYRTPLLTFLHEHGASEALSRLAAKYDPGISARLSQLFELRLVASNRSDLIPVAQSVADQIVTAAKSVPFRTFVKELPAAAQVVKPSLFVEGEGDLCLRDSSKGAVFELPIVVTPNGLVPVRLEAALFDGDDVFFEEDVLRTELSGRPLYFPTEFTLKVRFGSSWFSKGSNPRDSLRVRIRAKTLTDEVVVEDVICRVRSFDSRSQGGANLNTDTLLDIYPGVSNTPAVEDAFIGRHDELECLNQVLVSARRPSPVLLTGMRRIGKTSLLFAFHNRLRQPGNSTAISFYLSLAERRVEFVAHDRSVSATIFRAISHGIVRPNLSTTDQNHALCTRIRQKFDGDWKAARKAIQECFDEESLSGSLIALSEKILEWVGAPAERFILLIDEAESLVAPYQAGGNKKLELEQLLQSLREVSQTTGAIGILLSGSNHINIFAREYKNAFFGSSQIIELAGLKDAKEGAALIAPLRVNTFVQFDLPAIEYAFSLCAGMPQFLWQVGATVAHLVRAGAATKRDVRVAIAALVGEKKTELPFKSYEILEPIDSMLALESARERDLLWMLLYRIANASSLVAEDATVPFVIDHALAALDERSAWTRRLRSLVDLKILRMESSSTVRFQVPLFAEGFRAKKYWQEYNVRLQGVAI